MSTRRRIDIHHHFFPPSIPKAKINMNMGWRTPAGHLPWSPQLSLSALDTLKIDMAILSIPAYSSGSISQEGREVTRSFNEDMAKVARDYPGRFGFFAALPFLDDIKGAIEEIKHGLDVLHADGVSLSSSYGEGSEAKYIADDLYDPLWEELNRRGAVVFLHGAMTPSSTPYPCELLGLPITEVPNETYKAAAHLVVTGKKRKYHNVKIILSHLGGSTPFLAPRVAVLSRHMGCSLTPEEILEDFKSFYFDTALSSYSSNLAAMQKFTAPDRLLFGTDFPAVSVEMIQWYNKNLEDSQSSDEGTEMIGVWYENAAKLFPRVSRMSWES